MKLRALVPALALSAMALACLMHTAAAADLSAPLKTLLSVTPEGQRNAQAGKAWQQIASADAADLPQMLAALDQADPLPANWIRAAVDTVAERNVQAGKALPKAELEKFVLDRKHDSRARRLAYEWLTRVDDTAESRLIPGMLDDPSAELRRDAVARLIEQAKPMYNELGELIEAKNKPQALAIFRQAMQAARDEDQVELVSKRLTGLGEEVNLPRHFGFLVNWHLIAPFDNTDESGFDVVYPPEKEIKLDAKYQGKENEVSWVEHKTDDDYGMVDIATALAPHKGAICYAYTEFTAPEAMEVDLRLGCVTAWKLWLNGELVFSREEYHRGMRMDQYIERGKLKQGKNTLLLKICQNEQDDNWAQRWQFQLRVCDETGTAILSSTRSESE